MIQMKASNLKKKGDRIIGENSMWGRTPCNGVFKACNFPGRSKMVSHTALRTEHSKRRFCKTFRNTSGVAIEGVSHIASTSIFIQ
jgi:hypothetical protein